MRILFQGDSITDTDRSRQDLNQLGRGYAHFVKAALGSREPNAHVFMNRGICADRIVDLYTRIKSDVINLQPDFLSILIGVNGVLHEIEWQNGVDAEKFEKIYTLYLEEIRAALPQVKLMLLEPFVLPGTFTSKILEDGSDKYTLYREGIEVRSAAVRRIADKFGAHFLPLQDMFDDAVKEAPPSYWMWDGVHPTEAGHYRIAQRWMQAYDTVMGK